MAANYTCIKFNIYLLSEHFIETEIVMLLNYSDHFAFVFICHLLWLRSTFYLGIGAVANWNDVRLFKKPSESL